MKKFFGILGGSVLTLALLLSSCGGGRTGDSDSTTPGTSTGSSDTGGGSSSTPETPVEEVHYSEDTREAIYTVYSESTGEAYGSYKSLYDAIAACANDGDVEDYVTKGTADDVKLFINYDAYSETTQDMFWYYENGTSLDKYVPWLSTYFADLYTASSQDIVVFKQSAGTFSPYYQGTEVVALGEGQDGTVATWNVYRNYDANVQVDMEPYSGIVKSAYTIDFTEASIRPTYEGEEPVYAKVGFIMPDSYIVASFGIYCDTTDGNWYYYYGDINTNADPNDGYDGSLGTVYTDEFVMSSTWDEEEGVWHPDHDIVMTGEIVTMGEGEDTYYVDRLTIADAETNEQIFTRDYEAAAMTACATVRFNVGLDIYNYDNDSLGLPNYDNGAEFTNIVVTNAVGTVTDWSIDPEQYGGEMSTIETPGDYDLMNSSEVASEARYKTYVYNAGVVDYDFDTPGSDVYGFSFRLSQDNTEYSTKIERILELYEKYDPADYSQEIVNGMTEEEQTTMKNELQEGVDLYGSLSTYQYGYLPDDTVERFNSLQLYFVGEDISAFISYVNEHGLNDLSGYNGIAAVTALEANFDAAKEMYDAIVAAGAEDALATALEQAGKPTDLGVKVSEVAEFIDWVKTIETTSDAYVSINYIMATSYTSTEAALGSYSADSTAEQLAVYTWYTSVEPAGVFPMATAQDLSLPAAVDVLFGDIYFQKFVATYHNRIDTIEVMEAILAALDEADLGITAAIAKTGDSNNWYEYQGFEFTDEQWAIVEEFTDEITSVIYWWGSVNYDGTLTWQSNTDINTHNLAVWYTGGSDGYNTWNIRNNYAWGEYSAARYQSAIALLYEIALVEQADVYGVDWTHGHIFQK